MPMTREQAFDITSKDFFNNIKLALEQPSNTKSDKIMVPLADMERLAKYVEMDCLRFG